MKAIYKANNSIEANLVLTYLEQYGIKGRIEGEHLQGIELLQNSGFPIILVTEEDYEEAKKVVDEYENDNTESDMKRVKSSSRGHLKTFLLGAIVGASSIACIYYLPIVVHKMDRNRDGKSDEKATYINYQLSKMEFDRNFDGKADFKYQYNHDGSPKNSKSDENFDGIFETKAKYRNGNVTFSVSDTTNDGFEDYRIEYKHGVVNKIIFISPKTKKPIKIQYIEDMKITSAQLDTNGDGVLDQTYKYDQIEEIIK